MSKESIRIASNLLRADISPRGAELMSLVGRDGRECLWQGDPALWSERSPILFPVVGRLQGDVLCVDGREFPMPIHGFARAAAFTVSQLSDSSALFQLRASEATRVSYPWDFGLDVTYTITEATLTAAFVVSNLGNRAMPYMLGFHPGFRSPLDTSVPHDDYELEFDADNTLACEIGINGFAGEAQRVVKLNECRLPLSYGMFAEGAVIFPNLRSRRVSYVTHGSTSAIFMCFTGFSHLALWTKSLAQFLSMTVESGPCVFA